MSVNHKNIWNQNSVEPIKVALCSGFIVLFALSCGKSDSSSSSEASGTTQTTPTHLFWRGSSNVSSNTCTAFSLSTSDSNDNSTNVAAQKTINLSTSTAYDSIQTLTFQNVGASSNVEISQTGAQVSANFSASANAATIQSALEGLSTVGAGNVTVTGSSTLGAPIEGVQTLTASNATQNGTWAGVSVQSGDSASTVQSSLRALGGVYSNVAVTGSSATSAAGFSSAPVASASSTNGNAIASQAFDGQTNSNTLYWESGTTMPVTLQMDAGAGSTPIATGYKIYTSTVSGNYPKTWTFQGSTDGSTWVDLDSKSNMSLSAGSNTFTFSNSASYRYYRLRVTAVGSAGQSARIVELEITGGLKPSSSSIEANTSHSPGRAFDGIISSNTDGEIYFASSTSIPAWLMLDLGSGNTRIATGYKIYTTWNGGLNPSTWQFQGSNDGSSWTTLDSKTNQTLTTGTCCTPFAGGSNTYTISNSTAYRYYRLYVTASQGTSIAIVEFEISGTQAISGQYTATFPSSLGKVSPMDVTGTGWSGAVVADGDTGSYSGSFVATFGGALANQVIPVLGSSTTGVSISSSVSGSSFYGSNDSSCSSSPITSVIFDTDTVTYPNPKTLYFKSSATGSRDINAVDSAGSMTQGKMNLTIQ
jgi:hypothetical protein